MNVSETEMNKRNKVPLTAIVLTYNEEKNIEDCLKSVYEWVDEIFVVDSFSTDDTLDIASKYTDKIYTHSFENYSAQRNWAQENLPIRNDWVFHLDADERATQSLADELYMAFEEDLEGTCGFLTPRMTVFFGRWIKHGGHYPTYHLRVFRKEHGRCEDRLYDQHFYTKGQLMTLKSNIIDITASDINTWRKRHHKWAYLEALEVVNREDYENEVNNKFTVRADRNGNFIEKRRWLREKYYSMPVLLRPFIYFIYRYVVLRGFLDGKEGLIFHVLQGLWYRFKIDLNICALKMQKKKGQFQGGLTPHPVHTLTDNTFKIAILNITSWGMSKGYIKFLKNIIPKISSHLSESNIYVALPEGVDMLDLKKSHPNIQWNIDMQKWMPNLITDKKISKAMELFAPDVIFIPTARVMKNNKVPVVTMIQNMEPISYDGPNPFIEKIVNKARLREARKSIVESTRVIAISNFVKNTLINKFNTPPEKIGVAYLGVDITDGKSKKPDAGPDEWAGKFLFVAGSIRPARGLEDLFVALRQLKDVSEIAGLLIAGEVSPHMETYFNNLQLMIREYQLDDKICWIGNLDEKEMNWCYQNCYAFIMSSRVEACPNIALEAMSNGCICISNDSFPMPEIFGDAATYYSYKKKPALTEAIQEVLSWDMNKRNEASVCAKKRAEDYSWDICAEKIISEMIKAIDSFKNRK